MSTKSTAPRRSRALPFTRESVARAIRGIEKAGKFAVGLRPDGTLIIGDKPVDVASLVPVELEQSPVPPVGRRFGEKINGGQSDC